MTITPRVGMKVRFHLGASLIEERQFVKQSIQKASYTGTVVDVFGKENRFAKIDCTKIGKPIVVDKEAIVAVMESYKYEKEAGNPVEALAFKFNQSRNK